MQSIEIKRNMKAFVVICGKLQSDDQMMITADHMAEIRSGH